MFKWTTLITVTSIGITYMLVNVAYVSLIQLWGNQIPNTTLVFSGADSVW